MGYKTLTPASEIDIGNWDSGATDAFTIGFWTYVHHINPPFPTDGRFISKATGTSTNDHRWMVGMVDSGGQKWRCRLKTVGSNTQTFIGTTTLDPRVWYLSLFEFNGANVKLVINNKTEFDTPKGGSTLDENGEPIFIGNNAGDDKAVNDTQAEVFVLKQLLTDAEKTLLWNGFQIDQIVKAENISCYYPLDPRYKFTDKSFNNRPSIPFGIIQGLQPPRVEATQRATAYERAQKIIGSIASAAPGPTGVITYGGNQLFGNSADVKPLDVAENSQFTEVDTFNEYLFRAGVWELMP